MNIAEFITDNGVVASSFTLVGMVLLKLGDLVVNGRNMKISDAEKYKLDLQKDIERLEKQVNEAWAEVGKWRQSYYDEVQKNIELQRENSELKLLKHENESIKRENKELKEEMAKMRIEMRDVKTKAANLAKKVDEGLAAS